jgi:hypothetical protein
LELLRSVSDLAALAAPQPPMKVALRRGNGRFTNFAVAERPRWLRVGPTASDEMMGAQMSIHAWLFRTLVSLVAVATGMGC